VAGKGHGGDTDGGGAKSPRKQGAVGEKYDAEFRGFINLDLPEEQRARFDVWVTTANAYDMFDVAVADGVVLSVKLDTKSDGYLASATQRRVASPNAGLVVTARAKTPQVALWRLVFCLYILSVDPSWEATQAIANPDRW